MSETVGASEAANACHRDRMRDQVEHLRKVAQSRAFDEEDIVHEHATSLATEQKRVEKAEADIRSRYDRELEATRTEYVTAVEQLKKRLSSERSRISATVERAKAEILKAFEARSAKVDEDLEAEEIPHREVYKERLVEAGRR
ncbi:MAG: hypothetical protein ACKOCN_05115, partial [Planctomycetaceae bacterium]